MVKWEYETTEELKRLYIETDTPSDTLIKDKKGLSDFTQTLNTRLSNMEDFAEEEVASKLLSLRKSGKLPRLRI